MKTILLAAILLLANIVRTTCGHDLRITLKALGIGGLTPLAC